MVKTEQILSRSDRKISFEAVSPQARRSLRRRTDRQRAGVARPFVGSKELTVSDPKVGETLTIKFGAVGAET